MNEEEENSKEQKKKKSQEAAKFAIIICTPSIKKWRRNGTKISEYIIRAINGGRRRRIKIIK